LKGKEMAVQGKLVHNSYENKEGEKRYFTQVNVQEFLMLNR